MVRLHLDTTPPAPAAHPRDTLVQSSFFGLRIRVGDLHDPTFTFAQGLPGRTPGAALLPTPARVVEHTPDSIGADLREPVRRAPQRSLEGRERPGRGPIHCTIR